MLLLPTELLCVPCHTLFVNLFHFCSLATTFENHSCGQDNAEVRNNGELCYTMAYIQMNLLLNFQPSMRMRSRVTLIGCVCASGLMTTDTLHSI